MKDAFLIYVINEKRLEDYIIYFLNKIKKHFKKVFVIVRSSINEEDLNLIKKNVKEVKVVNFRNVIQGYKIGIILNYNEFKNYKNIVFSNDNIVGPINSLDTLLGYFDKDLDIFSLFKYYSKNKKNIRLPDSDFLDFKSSLLSLTKCVNIFKKSFNKTSFELKLSKFINRGGLKYKSIIDNNDSCLPLSKYGFYFCVNEYYKNLKSPFFKKDIFDIKYNVFLSNSHGENIKELIEYIKEKTDYPVELIWKYVIKNYNLEHIINLFNLNYILPSKKSLYSRKNKIKIGVIFHLYYVDQFSYIVKYLLNVPKSADILITTTSNDKKRILLKEIKYLNLKNINIKVIPNRGRDITSFLIGSKNFALEHDLICFAHDKKGKKLTHESVEKSWYLNCMKSLLCSKEYVSNIINLFNNEKKLGLLGPVDPYAGLYYLHYKNFWNLNYKKTKKLYKDLKLNVPFNKKIGPSSPLGSYFWFRPKAFLKMYNFNFKYSDFPDEPLKDDNSISHSIERIRGYVVQDSGYYFAYCIPDVLAQTQLCSLKYMLKNTNRFFSKRFKEEAKNYFYTYFLNK